MGVPSSEADICNLALSHLSVDAQITSLLNPTKTVEQLCANWYDVSRRSTLRMHTWNFAMKRANLAELGTSPISKYQNQYQLPSDYIRIASIGANNEYKDYAIEGGKILLSIGGGSLPIRYVYDNESIGQYDPLFVDLFALELAYNVSFPISGNLNVRKTVKMMRDEKRREAFGVDGQERPPRRVERSKFLRARRRNGTYASQYVED